MSKTVTFCLTWPGLACSATVSTHLQTGSLSPKDWIRRVGATFVVMRRAEFIITSVNHYFYVPIYSDRSIITNDDVYICVISPPPLPSLYKIN